jgi:tRNA (guanine-N7-)-methyltransferase
VKKKSREVISEQNQEHIKTLEVVLRNRQNVFKKPIPDFSQEAYKVLEGFVDSFSDKREIILDLCCGVGESSFHFAQKYKESIIVGVDKSADRIERKNEFKKNLPKNLLILRADIIDIIRLLAKSKLSERVSKVFLLYPNPYPKTTQFQKRWHGHGVFPYLMKFDASIEVRSNWEIYLKEFLMAANCYKNFEVLLETFVPSPILTPFERKFFDSKQLLYKLELSPGELKDAE